MAKKPDILTNEDFNVIKAIQKGMRREHVIKKYQITGAKFDDLSSVERIEELKVDQAITKLTSNKSLLKAAEAQGIDFLEELHGLARLDQNMQLLANSIINKLSAQVAGADEVMELQIIIQSFVMMRKAMFSSGPGVQVNNFSSMPAITGNRI